MDTVVEEIPTTAETTTPKVVALLAEFPDVDSVVAAAKKVRAAGYERWDVHSPFPIHGIDAAMGTKPTVLPWIVLACGLSGMLLGLGLAIYANAVSYKFLVSGKPFMSLPAFVPVIFELTVLFSAFGAVFGMLALNRLPMLYNPLFKSDRFRRVTSDRFFIVIDAADQAFDESRTTELLLSLGATAVETVED